MYTIVVVFPKCETYKSVLVCYGNTYVLNIYQVQLQLFSVFATDLVNGVGCAAHIRREVGVRRLMYMLKEYYWLEKTIGHIDTGASRPSKEDIKSLRPYLLLLVKQLVLKVP